MNVTPSKLKRDFEELLEEHKAKENVAEFLEKRRKIANLKLEPKHTTNTMTEIFQDPDLLSRISTEASRIMNDVARPSRARREQDLITFKKPQAKDVVPKRYISDEMAYLYDSLEQVIDKDREYINPLTPKQRKYVAQEEQDKRLEEALKLRQQSLEPASEPSAPPSAITEPAQILQLTNSVSSSPAMNTITTPDTTDDSQLQSSTPDMSDQQNQAEIEEDTNELSRLFDDASYIMNTSPLHTVGSKYLYHLLPRQAEPMSYAYVKEDYIPDEKKVNKNERLRASATQDTIITITIFQPGNPNLKFQQIEILGSQLLSDIRDVIYCQSDFKLNNDRKGQDPNGEVLNSIDGAKLTPSLIYFNHTFYIDTRYQDTQPPTYYDNLIFQWIRKNNLDPTVFHFNTKFMQKSRLEDIQFTMRKPILFIHQNTCEHMMLVQDVRLLSPDNDYNINNNEKDIFPRTTHSIKYNRLKCNMCGVYPATRMTTDDIFSGFSPCYFCTVCFNAFHPSNDTNASFSVEEYYGTPGYKSAR